MDDAITRLEEELAQVAAMRPMSAVADTRRMRPKDAATLIVLDRSGPVPSVLMGRRNAKSRFMPNKFVFPGGRVEPQDRNVPVAGVLDLHDEERLLAGSPTITPSRSRSLALAAIRETYEETGYLIGTREHGTGETPLAGTWAEFGRHGVLPALDGLRVIARAITPPNRSRRFDTRFFVVDASWIAHRVERVVMPDDELTEIRWVALDDLATVDLPGITHVILDELKARLAAGLDRRAPIPFYRFLRGAFIRTEV